MLPKKRENHWVQVKAYNIGRNTLRQIIACLSLVVIFAVFWSLKLTGIGIAGEAFCGREEHVHSEECLNKTLICTLSETPLHVHGESCLHKELICQLEEGESHTHEEACWLVGPGFGCGQLEKDGHIHIRECITGETHLDCGIEVSDGHVHVDSCYEITKNCLPEEHIHIESCYSDITADLETSDDWELTLSDMTRGPTTRENVVLVARSQLGYTESTLNFQVDANGVRRGITRYGQWYGNPYGDWSAMFASFCLDYAGVKNVPMNAGTEAMRLEWAAAGFYKTAQAQIPEIGNLLFLNKGEEKSQEANAVAIIIGVDDTVITAIEGDLDNTVAETQYNLDDAAVLGYGIAPEAEPILMLAPAPQAVNYTIWLDGTDGGLGHLTGSPNTAYTAQDGSTIKLPDEWTSPSKYSYKLRGWYDVTNACYYPAGAEMEVTGNAVLYADWVAATYNLGQFNAQVANTVSTNAFITTHMFDYNYLFNVQSSNAQVTVNDQSHSETWSMVSSGTVKYNNAQTLDLIFAESDGGGRLTNPNNRSSRNTYRNADTISAGICTPEMRELLYSPYNAFNPETCEGVVGKTYLGTGDHLFQIMDNPDDEYFGYYYYDSLRNAISYNQGQGRFYVYEYLSATSDAIGSSYADFLPLNSPYANTNGRTMRTYTYNGHYDEYRGVTHYRYDTESSESGVMTEFAYGMRSDINFYLPNDPGSGGNKDIHGKDIEFLFSGDDDLWVLIDGIVVLDIGGIHQRIAGDINFSTGEVNVNGRAATSLMDLGITSGDHTLTVLYMERGASMSNCSIYFNLVPRFGLEIQKEDVLTQDLLDGTQFTVYEDFECTKPAELWASEDAYKLDYADGTLNQFQSTFTVMNGVAKLWGLGSGSTYYIKETKPPDAEGYVLAKGVIQLTIEKAGMASYSVDVIADAEGNEPSVGFTVHGVNIDEETQTVYIVTTNAPETVKETTTVQVFKKWEDNEDHSADYIQVYLTVTDSDGSVRRIREITLSDENDWNYTWTNLPKYDYSQLSEVKYGIEESYESGYYSTVRQITELTSESVSWAEAAQILDGESFVLRQGANNYLSTTSETDAKLKWVNEQTAKASPLALWTVDVADDGTVKFTNGVNQTLGFNAGSNSSARYFYASNGTPSNQYLTVNMLTDQSGFRLIGYRNKTPYYAQTLNNTNGRLSSTGTERNGMILIPVEKMVEPVFHPLKDWGYQITNTPLPSSNETSMTVKKEWNIPEGYDASLYQEFNVTVQLLANGVNTGRTITLNLKNNWQGTFLGLPYTDTEGNVIVYTVQENWEQFRWSTHYGDIRTINTTPVSYSTVITNSYYAGGPQLPSTGSSARIAYVLCGSGLMLGTLLYGIGSRRKRERRMK